MTFPLEMTYSGLMKTMTISFFKAHISEQLRKVRRGARLVISDRDTPIAEVVPYQEEQKVALPVRDPRSAPFELPRPTVKIDHDPLEFLMDDRNLR